MRSDARTTQSITGQSSAAALEQRKSLERRRFLQCATGAGLSFLAPTNGMDTAVGNELRENGTGRLFASNLPKIKACIFVFYYGGPSHLDTFDMKPNAPAEIRGEFKPIATSVPGIQISEHLPHTAKVMHKLAVVRSMHHTNRLHDSAAIETFTGRQGPNGDREEFAPIPQFFPCHGAVLSYAWQQRKLDVSHAALPWMFHNVVDVPCQGGGFLGTAFDPMRIQGDPDKSTYRADMLARPDGLSNSRMTERRRLLDRIEQPVRTGYSPPPPPQAKQLRGLYDKAYDLIASPTLRMALDIEQEPASVRERYGMLPTGNPGSTTGADMGYGRNLRGQNLLLARRLVESGIPYVNIYDFRQQGQNWDSHADNFGQHKNHLLPPADRSLAALINDLDERGLLESTLVIATGEFGRTPKINPTAGRDHWPDCYSVVLAGGGVKGGTVFGSSDQLGAFPATDPVTPADLAATIYWRFGIHHSSEIRDAIGRPHRLADGKPIMSLFG